MNINEMLLREDFYSILQETLTYYFKTVRGVDVVCAKEPFEGGEEFRIFSRSNIVCRAKKPKGAKEYLRAEYNIRNSIWKYIVGKMFVLYLMNTKTAFSNNGIFITKGVVGENELFSPQNRSLRIYDYEQSYVDCIIKKGFTSKYFNNQIEFRREYRYDFMVPLIDSGEDWFREPILKGHPLARVTDEDDYQRGIKEAVVDIRRLAHDTMENVPLQEYIIKLLEKARKLTSSAKDIKKIATFEKCEKLLKFIEESLKGVDIVIPVCMSHGDLQTGNIWMNKDGRLLIYDWETAGRRSVWYDSTTLLYSLRRPYGWGAFYNELKPQEALACDPIKNRSEIEFKAIKNIVLLEDYLFLLEDMMELPSKWGSEIFDNNIDRISNVVYGS